MMCRERMKNHSRAGETVRIDERKGRVLHKKLKSSLRTQAGWVGASPHALGMRCASAPLIPQRHSSRSQIIKDPSEVASSAHMHPTWVGIRLPDWGRYRWPLYPLKWFGLNYHHGLAEGPRARSVIVTIAPATKASFPNRRSRRNRYRSASMSQYRVLRQSPHIPRKFLHSLS